MTNRMENLIHRKARAQAMKMAYERDGVKAAIEAVRETWKNTIVQSKPEETAIRELAYGGLKSMEYIEHYFMSAIADGQASDAEVKYLDQTLKGHSNGRS